MNDWEKAQAEEKAERQERLQDMGSDEFHEAMWERPFILGTLITLLPVKGEDLSEGRLRRWLALCEDTLRMVYELPRTQPNKGTDAPVFAARYVDALLTSLEGEVEGGESILSGHALLLDRIERALSRWQMRAPWLADQYPSPESPRQQRAADAEADRIEADDQAGGSDSSTSDEEPKSQVEAVEEPEPAPAQEPEPEPAMEAEMHGDAPERDHAPAADRAVGGTNAERVLTILAEGPATRAEILKRAAIPLGSAGVLADLAHEGKIVKPEVRGGAWEITAAGRRSVAGNGEVLDGKQAEQAVRDQDTGGMSGKTRRSLDGQARAAARKEDLSNLEVPAEGDQAQRNIRRRVLLALKDGALSIPEVMRVLIEDTPLTDDDRIAVISAIDEMRRTGEIVKHPKLQGQPRATYGLSAEGEQQVEAEQAMT